MSAVTQNSGAIYITAPASKFQDSCTCKWGEHTYTVTAYNLDSSGKKTLVSIDVDSIRNLAGRFFETLQNHGIQAGAAQISYSLTDDTITAENKKISLENEKIQNPTECTPISNQKGLREELSLLEAGYSRYSETGKQRIDPKIKELKEKIALAEVQRPEAEISKVMRIRKAFLDCIGKEPILGPRAPAPQQSVASQLNTPSNSQNTPLTNNDSGKNWGTLTPEEIKEIEAFINTDPPPKTKPNSLDLYSSFKRKELHITEKQQKEQSIKEKKETLKTLKSEIQESKKTPDPQIRKDLETELNKRTETISNEIEQLEKDIKILNKSIKTETTTIESLEKAREAQRKNKIAQIKLEELRKSHQTVSPPASQISQNSTPPQKTSTSANNHPLSESSPIGIERTAGHNTCYLGTALQLLRLYPEAIETLSKESDENGQPNLLAKPMTEFGNAIRNGTPFSQKQVSALERVLKTEKIIPEEASNSSSQKDAGEVLGNLIKRCLKLGMPGEVKQELTEILDGDNDPRITTSSFDGVLRLRGLGKLNIEKWFEDSRDRYQWNPAPKILTVLPEISPDGSLPRDEAPQFAFIKMENGTVLTYELIGIGFREGPDASSGHYRGAIRKKSTNPSESAQWIHFDDKNVSPPQQLRSEGEKRILMYQLAPNPTQV